jgi:hypothetical protein
MIPAKFDLPNDISFKLVKWTPPVPAAPMVPKPTLAVNVASLTAGDFKGLPANVQKAIVDKKNMDARVAVKKKFDPNDFLAAEVMSRKKSEIESYYELNKTKFMKELVGNVKTAKPRELNCAEVQEDFNTAAQRLSHQYVTAIVQNMGFKTLYDTTQKDFRMVSEALRHAAGLPPRI